jgi:hypothetical protein
MSRNRMPIKFFLEAADILPPPWDTLFKAWLRAYEKRPKRTVIVSIVFGVLMIAGAISIATEIRKNEEEQRRKNQDYTQQLNRLNEVEGSLKNLTEFVETQKKSLKETEDAINNLKKEEETLRPVVESDRRAIETLFELQAQRNQESIWRERIVSFVLGVIASIMASFVWALIIKLNQRRKPKAPAPQE